MRPQSRHWYHVTELSASWARSFMRSMRELSQWGHISGVMGNAILAQLWLGVILVRGATDGWVPYPFLDPATGYGKVAVYCLVIAAVTILFGYGVYALSRVRILGAEAEPR